MSEPEPFRLQRPEPPKRQPENGVHAEPRIQLTLFSPGTGDLPGQKLMFDEITLEPLAVRRYSSAEITHNEGGISMLATVYKPVTLNIKKIILTVTVDSDDQDDDWNGELPPGWDKDTDTLQMIIDIDSGQILSWPAGNARAWGITLKVVDRGTYRLIDDEGQNIATIEDYVPNEIIPGSYGDYIELEISPSGLILNWPKHPDVSAFFKKED